MMVMHWRKRADHDVRGTGLPVECPKEAARLCHEANMLFPAFTHWAEKEQPDEQDG